MNTDEKLHIIVAETSPILAAGVCQCLRRMQGLQTMPAEVHTLPELLERINTSAPDIIFANPTFGGVFDPTQLRGVARGREPKIIAIAVSPLTAQARELYDETISLNDDVESIARKIRGLLYSETSETDDGRDQLSQREKEIVALVAKGLTNKEIADALFLSVHTVITHRRNIAKKLEIHSATGLTIYAIVNHLVDLSDIKL